MINRPLLWSEGTFLKPQHFQQFDMYVQSLHTPFYDFISPFFWGIADLKIDNNEGFLTDNQFRILKVKFIFKDKTYVTYDENSVNESNAHIHHLLNIDMDWKDKKLLSIYAVLKKVKHDMNNVIDIDNDTQIGHIKTRFISSDSSDYLANDHKSIHLKEGKKEKIHKLDYFIKIIPEYEKDKYMEFERIEIAKLEKHGSNLMLSDTFIPASVTLRSSKRLRDFIKDNIYAKLKKYSNAFQEHKKTLELSSVINKKYVELFQAIIVLNRYIPYLYHVIDFNKYCNIHPWSVYLKLMELIGELSTFSDKTDIFGKAENSDEEISIYKHDDLWRCYSIIPDIINNLLTALKVPVYSTPLKKKNKYYLINDLPKYIFEKGNSYFILLRTNRDPNLNETKNLSNIKLHSTYDEVDKLVKHSIIYEIFKFIDTTQINTNRFETTLQLNLDSKYFDSIISNRSIALGMVETINNLDIVFSVIVDV